MSGNEPAESTLHAQLREFCEMFGADVTATIVAKFLESSAELLLQMQRSVDADPGQVRRSAHSLKGASLNIGALGLAHACAAVEAHSHVEGSLTERVARVAESFAEVREVLAATQGVDGPAPEREH